jgi:hypothetical protein
MSTGTIQSRLEDCERAISIILEELGALKKEVASLKNSLSADNKKG